MALLSFTEESARGARSRLRVQTCVMCHTEIFFCEPQLLGQAMYLTQGVGKGGVGYERTWTTS